MTICVIVNCLIVSTLNYQQKWQLLKPASFSKKYLSTIHMHWLWREREGERERMDKKTNLNANLLPRKDAWPPAHHSTDFSDWEIVKRKKRLSSTFLRILMFMMRRMRLMVMMMKMITTTTIMMTLTMIVRRMK